MRDNFRFKQFSVSDEGCAMKLGTDAVLLGSWINPERASTILDIGTGCGILALMMAQKSKAEITAVEIHAESAAAATVNCMNSPWSSRLTIVESSFQDFVLECNDTYDLIITNPPYFIDSLKAPSKERNLSRHYDSLRRDELLEGVNLLLTDDGVFSLILPYEQEHEFIQKAFIKGLYIQEILHIRTKPDQPFTRTCLSLSREKREPKVTELDVRDSQGQYTNSYLALTRAFYL